MLIYNNYWTFRKKKSETCLNGEKANFNYLYLKNKNLRFLRQIQTYSIKEHNSVPNQLLPRRQPGLYMVRCLTNDWRYYGESSNVSGRLASHKSLLNRKIHSNRFLQNDWNLYGEQAFEFVVLFMGETWELSHVRRAKETELIVLTRNLAYNIFEDASKSGDKNPFWKRLHSPESKQKMSNSSKGRPNDLLGQKISIKKVIYPSIAEASRQTNIARKTIRKKINDAQNLDYFKIE